MDVLSDPLLGPLERTPEGVRVGDCVLVKKIGQGGMGAVYLGWHENLQIEVAVKVLPFHAADTDSTAVARFQKEARATVRIDHPNIVRVFDVKEERGVHYLVMEFVDGESADGRIEREGPLPERDALEIAVATGEALAAAHAKGILHRDVKPANIMIRFEDGRVKLADLGLAKALVGEGRDATRLTTTGQMMGTPAYMSPEQATDASRVDERTDIYSLGATLYALLSGRAPFEATQLLNLLLNVTREEPQELRKLRWDVSEETAAAVRKLMAKKPAQRPQTMTEAVELLRWCFEAAPAEEARGLARPEMAGLRKVKVAVEGVTPTPRMPRDRTLDDVTPSQVRREARAPTPPPLMGKGSGEGEPPRPALTHPSAIARGGPELGRMGRKGEVVRPAPVTVRMSGGKRFAIVLGMLAALGAAGGSAAYLYSQKWAADARLAEEHRRQDEQRDRKDAERAAAGKKKREEEARRAENERRRKEAVKLLELLSRRAPTREARESARERKESLEIRLHAEDDRKAFGELKEIERLPGATDAENAARAGHLRALIRRYPETTAALKAREILVAMGEVRAPAATSVERPPWDELSAEIESLREKGDLAQARQELVRFLALDPPLDELVKARKLLDRLEVELARVKKEAEKSPYDGLRKVVLPDPADVPRSLPPHQRAYILLYKARKEVCVNDLQKALSMCEQALKIYPAYAGDVYFSMGMCHTEYAIRNGLPYAEQNAAGRNKIELYRRAIEAYMQPGAETGWSQSMQKRIQTIKTSIKMEENATKYRQRQIEVVEGAKRALSFFEKSQNADGSWGKGFKVAVTSLVVWAQVSSPLKLDEKNSAVAKGVSYILSNVQEDGSIFIPEENLANYNTSIALLALKSLRNPKYDETISKAKRYLLSCQRTDVLESDPAFGGVSYQRGTKAKAPDASNTGFWMDALKEAGLTEDDPAFKRALVFWKRVSNNPEVNDLEWAAAAAGTGEYGGFVYRSYGDDISKAGKFTTPSGKVGWRSYGSMTYNGLKAMIYCGLKKDSKEIKGALDWISHNYTVDENPGLGAQGQYYYYHTFAKALDALGDKYVVDENGVKHEWAKDLAEKLLDLQKPDGSWVNVEMRWGESDPALATAYALRALSIAIRQLER